MTDTATDPERKKMIESFHDWEKKKRGEGSSARREKDRSSRSKSPSPRHRRGSRSRSRSPRRDRKRKHSSSSSRSHKRHHRRSEKDRSSRHYKSDREDRSSTGHKRRSDRKDDRRPKEDKEEEEYKRRIEQQLEQMENSANSSEDEAEKLAEQRKQRLLRLQQAQQQKASPSTAAEQPTTNEDGGKSRGDNQNNNPNPQSNNNNNNTTPPINTDVPAVPLVDDIFSDSPVELSRTPNTDSDQNAEGEQQQPEQIEQLVQEEVDGQLDGFDDHEGYYRYKVEALNGRYHVFSSVGKGVFSSVVLARDANRDNMPVAIKIIRSNDTMYKAGLKELDILGQLGQADPENRRNCIRLIGHFEHRNHLCLVFEPMAMNLSQVLKKYGVGVGLSIQAVRNYTKQILVSVKHMHNCGIIHADIKPPNILVNEGKNVCKMSDFGSAFHFEEVEITPYLASRFYRAPEVVLGLKYGAGVDIWAVGCTLYELYTGKYCFPGRSNNEMLKLWMDLKGRFPNKMLRNAHFKDQHFDPQMNLLYCDKDPVNKEKDRVRVLSYAKPVKDLKATLQRAASNEANEQDRRRVNQFADLLEKMFSLDPTKRITAADALKHPFISSQKV